MSKCSQCGVTHSYPGESGQVRKMSVKKAVSGLEIYGDEARAGASMWDDIIQYQQILQHATKDNQAASAGGTPREPQFSMSQKRMGEASVNIKKLIQKFLAWYHSATGKDYPGGWNDIEAQTMHGNKSRYLQPSKPPPSTPMGTHNDLSHRPWMGSRPR